MKTIPTVEGKMYCVSATTECTITSQSGTVLGTASPGTPFWFQAQKGETTTLSDDAAEYSASRFNSAPQQQLAMIGVLGGGAPAWLKTLENELAALLDGSPFEVAWLSAENTLVIHTDRISDALLAAVKATAEAAMPGGVVLVQYNHNMEISWRYINKYAACKNKADMLAVNPDYANDLTSEGEWVYPLTALQNGIDVFRANKNLKIFKQNLPAMVYADYMYYGDTSLKIMEISAPELKKAGMMGNNVRPTSLSFNAPKAIDLSFLFSGWIYSPIKVWDIELGQYVENLRAAFEGWNLTEWRVDMPPKISNLQDTFLSSRLNKESALRIFNTLPFYTSGTHNITIGIHVDQQNDEEVLAAIANAESKGWTLTVRWNGTPTSTASTMAMGTLIYAKVSERKLPDGTTNQYIDWGHYVTNPEDYETFRSLASAYRYFGIPMPEETLTET